MSTHQTSVCRLYSHRGIILYLFLAEDDIIQAEYHHEHEDQLELFSPSRERSLAFDRRNVYEVCAKTHQLCKKTLSQVCTSIMLDLVIGTFHTEYHYLYCGKNSK